MPIKTRETMATLPAEQSEPLQFRNNPEIQKRLEAYKAANASDAAYFARVVKEAPERAVDMLLYKDMQRHESEMRLVEKQLPGAKAFYDEQSPEVRARIDQRPRRHESLLQGQGLRGRSAARNEPEEPSTPHDAEDGRRDGRRLTAIARWRGGRHRAYCPHSPAPGAHSRPMVKSFPPRLFARACHAGQGSPRCARLHLSGRALPPRR